MKILYAIQGTGNGHIARAEDVVPLLQEYGQVDLFVSGAQADIKLPYTIKYKSKGLSFYFGKDGGVDLLKTFKRNSARDVYNEIRKFPIENYDLVINDFESITAWACQRSQVPCVALSHQSALLSMRVPRPKRFDPVGDWILHNYAPVKKAVGFHFSNFEDNIYTPVIRARIRNAEIKDDGHYTVYLPAYDDKKILPLLGKFSQVRWHVFSKHVKRPYTIARISVFPINNEDFAQSLATSTGVLCGAGFETPAEALYLKKKLMVVPMDRQCEQHYNAAALKAMGVPVLKKLRKKNLEKIRAWISGDECVKVKYENITAQAVKHAVSMGLG